MSEAGLCIDEYTESLLPPLHRLPDVDEGAGVELGVVNCREPGPRH